MKGQINENTLEMAKSIILAILVLSLAFLSVRLWLQTAPTSSLPPVLIDAEGIDLREHIPTHLFQPVSVIYHDGTGAHRLASSEEDSETAQILEYIVASLQRGDIQRIWDDEGLEQILIRRQLDRPGATVLLPGPVPMNLWMKALGAGEGFPSVMMDRLYFFLTTNGMMNLYIPTAQGWYHTEWTVLDGLVDDMELGSIFPPVWNQELGGYETLAVTFWASRIRQKAEEEAGEPRVLFLGWRELVLSPLLSIPEMDVEVTTYMAESVLSDATEYVVSIFSDLAAVRQRSEPDRSTTYTDGYRSLRITTHGILTYTLVTPPDHDIGEIPTDAGAMLREAWGFLRSVLGGWADDLRLMQVQPTYSRGEQDADAHLDGYVFHFSQVFSESYLVAPGGPVSVRVDEHGVRRATLTLLRPAEKVQRSLAITPISAVERCYQQVDRDGAEPVVQRVNLVHYPSEQSRDFQIVRPAWWVDLGEAGQYLVDAVSGEIITKQ